RGVVEALPEVPGSTQLLRGGLEVAPRHVEADGIAEDAAQCLIDGDIAAAAAEGYHQLDLVVQIGGHRGIRDLAGIGYDGVGRLHEEERVLAVRIVAHLARMRRVVAADAIDAANGEGLAALDGHRGDGRDGDRIGHGRGSLGSRRRSRRYRRYRTAAGCESLSQTASATAGSVSLRSSST